MTLPTEHYKKSFGFIMSIEDIELEKEYTFTVNPNDKYQFWDCPDRVASAQGYMTTYFLKQMSEFAYLELQMEISPKGRIHYHGTIMFYSFCQVKNFYLETIPLLMKNYEIEIGLIEDLSDWMEYCNKGKLKFGLPHFKSNALRLVRKAGKEI